ncbi:protein takeout [Leptinotarsa decemlineata]|uniref:protein takeout n=1 Tax=Leptinotarsa decemlineata TaxID=7539 RepID=UPI003D309FDC
MKLDIISVDTPGNFKISLKNVSIYGLEKLEVTGVKANLTEHVVNMNFSVPSYTLLSKYEMDGRILVLSLKGEGESNITATDVTVEYELKYDLVDKKGEQFVKIADQHVHYEVSRAYFNFTNLFNGDKLLGDSTINLLNDEWKSINDELKEGIEETIKSVSATIVGGIFEKVPYRFAFL